jgi:uncharacterized membrane protein YhaH (DUF805 family)
MEKVTRRKIKPIARKRRNYVYLLLSILTGILTVYMLLSYAPDYKITASNLAIPLFPFFIASLLVFVFSTINFVFIQRMHGLLASIFLFFYLLFRLLGLTHWIFVVLFIALFITLEFFINKQK